MVSAARIGALRVDLGANTAAFEKGMNRAERRMAYFGAKMGKVGDKISGIGKSLSIGITAPVLAAGAAFTATANKMAHDSRAMANSARIAGESFEEFQKQAFAAKTVGIEMDKLGDQFKDVRERVGEFVVTGSGPLQDAFDALGKKVPLAVKELQGLSGKDALQLIVSRMEQAKLTTEEMSFVLESLASDTTNLLPLLRNGGKAFDEIGSKANIVSDEQRETFERYVQAQAKLTQATQKLTVAIVDSGLLDTVVDLVEKFAEWTSNLAETNPTLLKVGTIVAGVAAAFGPFLVAIGKAIAWVGKMPVVMRVAGVALRGLLGPVGAVLLAIEGLYLVWKNWDTIGPILKGLYTSAKMWLQDKLGAVFNWVKGKIKAVSDAFAWLYDQVVGNSHIPDMVDGIAVQMARLDKAMVDPAQKAATSVEQAMRDMAAETAAVLDRLFPEFRKLEEYRKSLAAIERSGLSDSTKAEARKRAGRVLRDESLTGFGIADVSLNEGPLAEARRVNEAAERASEGLAKMADKAKTQTVQIAESFRDMAQNSIRALDDMVNAIRGGGFLDILGSAVNLFLQLGSTGLFGKGIAGNINKASVPGFANGTRFAPGGLAVVGERGPELVNLPRGSQVISNRELRGANSGRMHVTVGIDPRSGNVTAFVDGRIAATAPAVANAGSALAQGEMAARARRRIR